MSPGIRITLFNGIVIDQRNLGMSMKVKKSTVDDVRKRFETNKKKLEEKEREYDFNERLREIKEEVITKCLYVIEQSL